MFGQYQMYIGPDTIAGLGISLNMVFAVIAGGIWTLFGPTFGAVFTQLLSETLRILIQSDAFKSMLAGINQFLGTFSSMKINVNNALALDQAIYGLLLILFIIYMPKGIIGTLVDRWKRRGD
jgi:branched-chain amino acid transport system permease protein